MSLVQLIVIALLCESIWETAKMTWQDGKVSIDRIGALFIGLLLAIGTGMDLLDMIEIPMRIPYAGMALTGMLISRGANFIHDIITKIQK